MMLNQTAPTDRYKTSLCRQFTETGKCIRGDQCNFAHTVSELRRPSGADASAAKQSSSRSGYRIKCKYFDQGNCRLGDRCTFSHESGPVSGGNQSYQRGGGYTAQKMVEAPPAKSTAELEREYNVEDNMIKQMQLTDMIEGLKEFYKNDKTIQQRLKSAKDMTEFGNYDLAADILNQIFYSPNAGFKEREAFQKIMSQAVMNALEYIELSAAQGPGAGVGPGEDNAGDLGVEEEIQADEGPNKTGYLNQPTMFF